MLERATFTAIEVQAALKAVIFYERARAERLLRGLSADVDAAVRSNAAFDEERRDG